MKVGDESVKAKKKLGQGTYLFRNAPRGGLRICAIYASWCRVKPKLGHVVVMDAWGPASRWVGWPLMTVPLLLLLFSLFFSLPYARGKAECVFRVPPNVCFAARQPVNPY